MPTYSYSCAPCGGFELVAAMAEVTATRGCPECGRPAARRYAAPALHGTNRGLHRALDEQVNSADAPRVVSSVPARRSVDRRRGNRPATDPRHARLPRP